MGEKEITLENFERKRILHAVKILKELHAKRLEDKTKKKKLFSATEDCSIKLQITMKKIPNTRNIQMIKIPLPNSIVTDTMEVCLFTGDLDKKDRKAEIEPTVLFYKELLASHKIKCISEIIPLRQLRTDYKPFEAKRKLVAGYDVFLTEDKIAGCLPRVLGKFFFSQRKFPQQINMKHKDLKKHVESALSNTVLFLTGRGNTSCIDIARLDWPVKSIANNVTAAIKALEEKLPGSLANINGLYLKLEKSKALPIYLSFDSGNDIELPPSQLQEEVEAVEINTLKKTKVKVFTSGDIQVVANEEYQASDSDSDYETKILAEQSIVKKRKFQKTKRNKKAKKPKTVKSSVKA